jgi:putative peptide zinc metalloprotease protein
MNLSRILENALPDLPPQRPAESFPCMHPRHVAREHDEREGRMVLVIIPGGPAYYFRFTQIQYYLACLFDGKRSYAEIAELFTRNTGTPLAAENVKEFGEALDKSQFWYKLPQEESISLCHELMDKRHKQLKRKQSQHFDISIIELVYFDPDKYLTWIHQKLKWIYTPWYTAVQLAMVVVMFIILGARWGEVWSDSVSFYNFAHKGLADVAEFFAIFLLLGVVHETAHGMTCKHYGGESHRMGVFLMYLVPGVFCEVMEVYVYGGRWQRIITVAAGAWSEIMVCSYISVVWWFTAPGTWLHDFCYKLILSGGILCVLINWNPLARMDGYYIISELFRFFDLKGQSTEYLSSLVRKHIFRMPVTVPVLPPLRRVGFATYAFLSGLYSYSLMLFFVRILYRIVYNFSPQWAFLPAAALAGVIFKGRIKKFGKFLKEFYMDKRELMRAHWRELAVAGAVVVALCLIPLRRESVEGRFVLEPLQRAVLRAQVPGTVEQIMADEGEHVLAGAVIARLRDLGVQGRAAHSASEYRVATARATEAELRYADYGAAELYRQQLHEALRAANDQEARLAVRSPISGVVLTPHVHDWLGARLVAGAEIAEVADLSSMRARIFVPEPDMQKLRQVHRTVLRMDSLWRPRVATSLSISPVSGEVEPGLMAAVKYQGMHPPAFFSVEALVTNDGSLRDGMTGIAKIYGPRRSFAMLLLEPVWNAVARRLW